MFYLCVIFSHGFSQESNTSLSSDGRLRYYEADSEGFFVDKGFSSSARVSGDSIVQKKYDDMQRLIREISWLKDAERPVSIREIEYSDGSAFAKMSTTNNFSTMQRIVETYTDAGFISERKEYTLVVSGDSSSEESETIAELVFTKLFRYDNENRLIEETTTFSDDSSDNEKILYEFKLGNAKADTYSYSNGVLKKSVVYSTSGNWIETVFFSSTLYIKTVYENNEAILEEVYEKGEKIRERSI